MASNEWSREQLRAIMSLQTASVRKGNGMATARVCYATNGYEGRYGTHVTCSAYVPLMRAR